MTTEIVPTTQTALVSLLSDPAKLAAFPVETMERLFALDKEMREEAARRAYADAMLAVSQDVEPIRRTRQNLHTKSWYAPLVEVEKALNPIIRRHGFTLSFSEKAAGAPNMVRFCCLVRHAAGHCEEHWMEAPPDGAGSQGKSNKTGVQAIISTKSYIKRCLKLDIFDLELTDDRDGADTRVGPAAEPITAEQERELDDLMADTDSSKTLFCEHYRIAKLADLPQQEFARARGQLVRKRDRLKAERAVLPPAEEGGLL